MSLPAKKSKIDPFKTQKTKVPTSKSKTEIVEVPKNIAIAIDKFRDAIEKAKNYEGEATVYKQEITDFAKKEYTKRFFKGKNKNFKLFGNESSVMYIVMDSGAHLNPYEIEQLRKDYGDDFINELTEQSFNTVKFNQETLEKHYEQIVEALQVLPEEILENLFMPVPIKAVKGALNRSLKYLNTENEFEQVINNLKIKNYIK